MCENEVPVTARAGMVLSLIVACTMHDNYFYSHQLEAYYQQRLPSIVGLRSGEAHEETPSATAKAPLQNDAREPADLTRCPEARNDTYKQMSRVEKTVSRLKIVLVSARRLITGESSFSSGASWYVRSFVRSFVMSEDEAANFFGDFGKGIRSLGKMFAKYFRASGRAWQRSFQANLSQSTFWASGMVRTTRHCRCGLLCKVSMSALHRA